jgi:electron transport complex protein RnfA
MNLFSIFIAAMLSNNVVLMRFLAVCPFIGMSTDADKSIGMGLAVTFVTVLATAVTWPLYHFVLLPLGLEFLQILAFILIIAALVQLVEFYLKKRPDLYRSMGIYAALITTNCAILGVTFDHISKIPFAEAVVYAVAWRSAPPGPAPARGYPRTHSDESGAGLPQGIPGTVRRRVAALDGLHGLLGTGEVRSDR